MGSTGSEAVIGGIRQTHLHFELWRNGIRVDPAPYFSGSAGGGGKPIRRKKEDMPAVIKRTEGAEEWSLIWPSLRGPDDKQRGYIVTTDETRARWWTRFYEAGFDSSDKFGRDEYVQAQEYARLDHEAWLAGQAVLSVVDPGSVEGATKQDVDAAADRVIEKIPTAEQNGSASRTAIVRPT